MSYYLVSVEPLYSQSVGDYLYLCESIEEAEKFRDVFRCWAITIFRNEMPKNASILSENTDWEFHEMIYTVDKESLTADSNRIPVNLIFERKYVDFSWLHSAKEQISNHKKRKQKNVLECGVPKLGCIQNNAEGVENIDFTTFLTSVNGMSGSYNIVHFVSEHSDSKSLIFNDNIGKAKVTKTSRKKNAVDDQETGIKLFTKRLTFKMKAEDPEISENEVFSWASLGWSRLSKERQDYYNSLDVNIDVENIESEDDNDSEESYDSIDSDNIAYSSDDDA